MAPSTGSDQDQHWVDGSLPRNVEPVSFAGYGGKPPPVEAGSAYPLSISRAISDTQEMIDFYQEVFGVQPTYVEDLQGENNETEPGKLLSYTLPNSKVAINYVYRPEGSVGGWGESTKWFQDYLNDVETKYQTTYKSCWPIWGDNHYCYDSGSQAIDEVVAKYEANKGKRGYVYHPFRNPGGRTCNGYFGEPSGWQFQLDGIYRDCPTDAESFLPNYCTTSCEA